MYISSESLKNDTMLRKWGRGGGGDEFTSPPIFLVSPCFANWSWRPIAFARQLGKNISIALNEFMTNILYSYPGERHLTFSNIRFEPGNKFIADVGSMISIAGLYDLYIAVLPICVDL